MRNLQNSFLAQHCNEKVNSEKLAELENQFITAQSDVIKPAELIFSPTLANNLAGYI